MKMQNEYIQLNAIPGLHGGEVGSEVGDALLVLVLHDLDLQPQAVLLLLQLLKEIEEMRSHPSCDLLI